MVKYANIVTSFLVVASVQWGSVAASFKRTTTSSNRLPLSATNRRNTVTTTLPPPPLSLTASSRFTNLRGGSSEDEASTATTATASTTSSSTLDAPNSLPSNVKLPTSIGDGSTSVVAESTAPPTTTKPKSSKWSNVQERTVPAVLMLAGAYAWIKYTGTNGVIALFTFLQAAMYSEGTNVVVSSSSPHQNSLEKWFIFVTFWMNTSGRIVFPTEWTTHKTMLDLVGYGMFAMSIVGFVLTLNAGEGGDALFRTSLQQLSQYWMNAFILVGQSSFWFATLLQYGLPWIVYPALLVIINDTMAYVFGFSMGKNPLLPQISPKKTWEGFVGAALSTLLLAKPLLGVCKIDVISLQHALAIAAFISFVSPFGGYLASVTKRAHGAKDFGTLIPGHGGVVDRLDCQVMTAPFMYFFLKHIMATTTTAE
mmetsp:Transcript_4443/g.6759  ORF Transcript_4443/g.6759 Transcript_4443/m.6759 type:complete len:424 (-) Transcript_4443:79-1350(-)